MAVRPALHSDTSHIGRAVVIADSRLVRHAIGAAELGDYSHSTRVALERIVLPTNRSDTLPAAVRALSVAETGLHLWMVTFTSRDQRMAVPAFGGLITDLRPSLAVPPWICGGSGGCLALNRREQKSGSSKDTNDSHFSKRVYDKYTQKIKEN